MLSTGWRPRILLMILEHRAASSLSPPTHIGKNYPSKMAIVLQVRNPGLNQKEIGFCSVAVLACGLRALRWTQL